LAALARHSRSFGILPILAASRKAST
jgi:hypothetical protein